MKNSKVNIVFFDGVCNFCNSSVQIIIKYDKNNLINFASQQSEIGKKILIDNGYFNNSLDTIIFLKNDELFLKSNAIIEICKLLNGFPRVVILSKIIPEKIRDYFYMIFSKHRYKLFGKKNACMIPSPEIRNKFL
jgi:predicted DCC family thiol-disulfide oxidoreductase YuxK